MVGWAALVGSTLAAVIAVMVITLGVVFGAQIRSAGDCETEDHPQACSTELEVGLIGSTLLGIAVWGVVGGWGLLEGRGWARRAVMISHGLWGIALGGYFVSVAAAPDGLEASGVVTGVCVTGAFLAIAVSAARIRAPGGS
jgi:hypothetical protein